MKPEIAILEILARRAPDMVREIPLHNELQYECGVPVSLADMRAKLRGLEQSGDAIAIANPDAGTKWTISDAGKARLARARE